jgi:ABC-type multidrug transport system fused ATPase/permease subunit
MLYAWGGYLVSQGMMPVGVLVSGIGFTFSLMYATQGAVNTLSELRRAAGAFDRVRELFDCERRSTAWHGAAGRSAVEVPQAAAARALVWAAQEGVCVCVCLHATKLCGQPRREYVSVCACMPPRQAD